MKSNEGQLMEMHGGVGKWSWKMMRPLTGRFYHLFARHHLPIRVGAVLLRFQRDSTVTPSVHYLGFLQYAGRLPAKMPLSTAPNVLVLYTCWLVSIALAAHSSGPWSCAVKETHHVPMKWSRVGPAPVWHTIRLQIGLKQRNFGELERHLYQGISNVPACSRRSVTCH